MNPDDSKYPSRERCLTALALCAALLQQAHADLIPGKGGNCSAVWDSQRATAIPGANRNRPHTLICSDGDPTCDTDGATNGKCVIKLNACVGEANTGCTPGRITPPLRFNGKLADFVAPDPLMAPACGTAGTLTLPLRRVPHNPTRPLRKLLPSRKVAVVMRARRFLNRLVVQCVLSECASGSCASCPPGYSSDSPSELTLTVPLSDQDNPQLGNGSDLDIGIIGLSHNFPVTGGASLKYCLSGCDGTTNTRCTGIATTGEASLNGPTFGTPLPLLAASVPVCVVNRFLDPTITNTFDLATGETEGLVKLSADVYLSNSSTEVCPRCVVSGDARIGSPGTCSASAQTPGAPCVVRGIGYVSQGSGNLSYLLANECIPQASQLKATLDIELPLDTEGAQSAPGPLPCRSVGQTADDECGSGACDAVCTGNACLATNANSQCIDEKGGISQVCCSNDTARPCFPTRNGGTIQRVGTRATDGQAGALAATFCIGSTQSRLIDTVFGLPGPGALILPVQVEVLPRPQ